MKHLVRGVVVGVLLQIAGGVVGVGNSVSAQTQDSFVLFPEAQEDSNRQEDVRKLQEINTDKDFWTDYNTLGDKYTADGDLGSQTASGVVTRDTIMLVVVRIVKFVSNAALVVGALMIIYAGYLYIMSAIAGDQTSQANEAIKDAIIGVVVVIFAFAIQQFVVQAFLV